MHATLALPYRNMAPKNSLSITHRSGPVAQKRKYALLGADMLVSVQYIEGSHIDFKYLTRQVLFCCSWINSGLWLTRDGSSSARLIQPRGIDQAWLGARAVTPRP